ncbi:hypothetical protein PAEPH01_0941 [Pancytospora epiphaga]|nr:hypothetical protein PAEPH01_0941 [Pancytospora epiphaga]
MSHLHFTIQFACKTSGQKELIYQQTILPKRLSNILEDLKKSENAVIFLKKVSKKEAPNYYDIIKHPMDLGTMTRKLLSYKNISEFKADLDLIWNNCIEYNTEEYFIRCAENMRKLADRKVYLNSRIYPSFIEEACNYGLEAAEARCLLKEAIIHYMDVVGFDNTDLRVLNMLTDCAETKLCVAIKKNAVA